MECLYISELNEKSTLIKLNSEESKHTKALRISKGDELLVTNGCGLTALCVLEEISKSGNLLRCIDFRKNSNEIGYEITLAAGILDNTDRFEFIIEKAVELGVSEIVPLITKHSGSKQVRYDRAQSKIIAALKQSKRSNLPTYTDAVYLSDLFGKFDNWDAVILADEKGSNEIRLANCKKILILCGPEGGFSELEIQEINKSNNLNKIKLSSTRLRSETAAIAALSVVLFNLE
ncbi:MAG: 16S rRNA (uracil(1498)-N(3))-methyltransferase [Candidatus Kapabacteria bacterium]|nr:16S rRNA (uracil(1498)-N(3))-methyltransferase [Ignavibacteriota bacterium]MCW5886266.1 16S rRNA (uracil(1498)-N(3))-methyltransferase [Candidatus Kapabacteria bacterium]